MGTEVKPLGRRVLAIAGFAVLLDNPLAAMPAPPPEPPSLGSAASFAILAGSAVRNSGATRIAGNAGVSPGSTVSNLPLSAFVLGTVYRHDATARQAQTDAAAAYDALAKGACVDTGCELGGKTFTPGVYCLESATLNGTVILDAAGDPDAFWNFRIAGALTTSAESSVIVTHGGHDGNVFWRSGGSVTVGARSSFHGNVLALANITLQSGAHLSGRALARHGTVTLEGNDVSLCCNRLTLTPSGLDDGMIGASYRQTITASGGTAPYSFAMTGARPPGLSLSDAGVLEGKPTMCGHFTFTITATDFLGCTESAVYEIEVDSDLTLMTDSLPDGAECIAYSHPITATGGTGEHVFTTPRGALPDGFLLSKEGVLSGPPTSARSFTFPVTVTDAALCSVSREYTVRILSCWIEPPILTDGTECVSYNAQFSVTEGIGPYMFSITAGMLPPGLSLLPEGGELSGTPSTAGPYAFTVTATDALMRPVISREYTMNIGCPVIVISPPTLPNGTVNQIYSEPITAVGCTHPYSYVFTLDAGELPPGLHPSMSGGLEGIPTVKGHYTFTVKAATIAPGTCSGTRDYAIDIDCPPILLSPLAPRKVEVGYVYDETITASGGIGPYTFDVVKTTLPPELDLLENGDLVGPVTTVGTFTFTVTATDTISKCVGSREYTIVVTPPVAVGFSIPALSTWAMFLLSVMLAGIAVVAIRR
jgi:hypothetical protein